jgi:3-hydroxybutyrate dehydrogenase
MCFGEFEWQTDDIIEQQIGVNLLGHMRVTKEFLPLIRKHRGRIVNVTSHCALKALPGLAPYAASKVALSFWTESLRMELKKYKVDVVNFIPGSYVTCTNISSRQTEYAQEMRKSMTAEQLDFYSDYFDEYNSYLKVISGYKAPVEIDDKGLMLKFERALRDEEPMKVYIHEPYR